MDSAPLKHSPLHAFHLAARAKMADFGGWEMPIEYPADGGGGVINEHTAVRERVGLFDVSHLGKAEVSGPGTLEFLNEALTNDLSKISDGQAQYTMLCDSKSGGVVDDLIAYRMNSEKIFLVPNAANTAEVVRHLEASAPQGVDVTNRHLNFAVLALQGPMAENVLHSLGFISELSYMSFATGTIAGKDVIICRTGYTGELGFEILPKWEDAIVVWNALYEQVDARGGLVAGLGARDTLRTEMGYPLHGHELSLEITPVQAGATWAVGWKKNDFWGKSALETERKIGPHRLLRGLLLSERGIPRAGMKVFKGEELIGETTSGTFSPSLKAGIALALIKPGVEIGTELTVDIRGKQVRAKVVKPPFTNSRVR